jgi:Cytochrome c554 and c-prime
MRSARFSALVLLAPLVAGLCLVRWISPDDTIHGRVVDDRGPVAGARVRLQGRRSLVLSDGNGDFCLALFAALRRPVIAWKSGYRIGASDVIADPLEVRLSRLPEKDNEDYAWVDPFPDKNHSHNCANCHRAIFDEWQGSAHARSARNPRFLSLYAGPGATWNLRREHPLGAGVCATCHAPTFTDATLEYDMTLVNGVAARGIHCDYCHKVADAPTDRLGTRFGRDGLTLLRPAGGEQFFFGPLEDAVRPGESFAYSPLYKESRYCASCHEGVVFGVHVYGTYSEWLKSPARARGQQCQTCHMAPTGTLTNIAPGKGGIQRDPWTLASHALPGGQAGMLQHCFKIQVKRTAAASGAGIQVEVSADNVGHRVPTGFIDRNLVLVVEAVGAAGKPANLIAGPRLPASAGKAVAGLPGKLYAKQLHADAGSPVPFWLLHGDVVDTRLTPGQPDRADFVFDTPVKGVRVRLLYRRFWPEVADARGWSDNETVVMDRIQIE